MRRTGGAPTRLALVSLVVVMLLASACAASGPAPSDAGPPRPAPGLTDPVSAQPVAGQAVDIGQTTVALSTSGTLRLDTLSARGSMVTGGDVFIAVSEPGAAQAPTGVTVSIVGGGTTVDQSTRVIVDPRHRDRLFGLVNSPADAFRIVATRGADSAEVRVTNHPTSGPIFAGARSGPFVCNTVASGLGPPTDTDCDAPTRYQWSWVDGAGAPHDLTNPAAVPADVKVITVNQKQVPFVLRTELGVLDRSIYSIVVLDPKPPASASPTLQQPTWSSAGWNNRLVYKYGGGCNTGYGQGASYIKSNDLELLAKGYAVTTSSLNTSQSLCNDTISAEVTMIVKEHFIKRYGVPDFTIGAGGSGGAVQQFQIVQNYPGLLDGITPDLPFADFPAMYQSASDCALLNGYWASVAGKAFTDEQRAAVEGFAHTTTCDYWASSFLIVLDPTRGCDPSLKAQVYNVATNPGGVRCTIQDSNSNIFGRDPTTGFGRRPLDNTGVQYGLAALTAGTITPDQFLDLNERVGGLDLDGFIRPARTAIDEATASAAYSSGTITEVGGLRDTPIIMRNLYTDDLGDLHDRLRVISMRERLRNADGSPDPNLVLWTIENTNPDLQKALAGKDIDNDDPIYAMDRWLTALAQTAPSDPMATRLAKARPADVADTCVVGGQRIVGDGVYDQGPCRDSFPVFGNTRTAAGGPVRDDIVKCALKPVAASDYPATFTTAQLDRLKQIFPSGVCDFTKPGVGQVPQDHLWPTFG